MNIEKRSEVQDMRYVASVGFLGYTRCNNVCAYNPESKGFDDLTPAEARRLIDQKQLKGLLWRNGSDGPEFYPDEAGFNQRDIMVKSANKFRPLLNDVLCGIPVNSFCTVVRVLDTDYAGRLYEIISNKYCRLKVTESNIRELNAITLISGVWITENEVRIADDVMYEDRRAGATLRKGVYKNGVPVEAVLSSIVATAKAEAAIVQAEDNNEDGIRSMASAETSETEPTETPDPVEPAEPTETETESTESESSEPAETLDSLFGNVEKQLEEQTKAMENNEDNSSNKSSTKTSKRTSKKK